MTRMYARPRRKCIIEDRGIVPYRVAWQEQRALVEARVSDRDLDDTLLLLEHFPVYTLGAGADAKFLKFDPRAGGREVYRVERGGEVTYHCPGQLVGYPILNLDRHRRDLHWYLRGLEEVILRVLDRHSLVGTRLGGLTGVWVEGYKVASIGVKVTRWITFHGFSLNVCPDLKGFEAIVPCGIEGRPVGSLRQFLPDVDPEAVRQDTIDAFAEVFQVEPERRDPGRSRRSIVRS
jgi:lipoyl(octanoyl) transferase